MTWHFLALKLICHLSSQSCSDVKSRQYNWQRQQNIGIYATQLKRLHQTSEISSIYIHGETNNGVCKLSMGLSSANSFVSDDLTISGMSLM
jgi:hypothetical protein